MTQLVRVIDDRVQRLAAPQPSVGVVAGQQNPDGTVDVRITGNTDTQPCYRPASYQPEQGHRVVVIHGPGWKYALPPVAGEGE